jgi:predicted TIM-barrel fold metal-dependent hydrolase
MIDAHVHLWSLEPQRYPWQPTLPNVPIPSVAAPIEDFIADADLAAVDLAIAVQPSVYGWNNSYLCEALDRYPGRLIGICMVDPRSHNAAAELRYWCTTRACRGLRINTVTQLDADWLLAPEREPLWDAAVELGIPVALQIEVAHVPVVARLAQRRTDLPIVLEYLGPGSLLGEAGLSALDALAGGGTIHLKVLMAAEESSRPWPHDDLWPFYRRALAAFGADRLMFGSAWPSQRGRMSYERACRWMDDWPFLNSTEREAICGGTALRFFAGSRRNETSQGKRC